MTVIISIEGLKAIGPVDPGHKIDALLCTVKDKIMSDSFQYVS